MQEHIGPLGMWRGLSSRNIAFLSLGAENNVNYSVLRIFFTSSTARGDGGSFKNRKPIGEIGCCESTMAEQKH